MATAIPYFMFQWRHEVFSTFYEAVGYTFSSYNQSKSHRLRGFDRETRQPRHTRELLDALGAPDFAMRQIKVTGSKGKGSTSRMIAGLLHTLGYRTGLFASPHLIDYTERIRVAGVGIAESVFMELLEEVRGPLERMQRHFAPYEYMGPVGIVLAVACLYFRQQRTDINVIELGRGARYDDVNRVAAEWSVITPVQYEHPRELGPDLPAIALNKSGVIGPGQRGVTLGRQHAVAGRILETEAEAWRVPTIVTGRDFGADGVRMTAGGTEADIWTAQSRLRSLHISLLGRHQADNLASALATVEAFTGRQVSEEALRAYAAGLSFAGRAQVLPGSPPVLLDGAINRETASLTREVIEALGRRPVAAVVAVPADKEYRGFLEALAPAVDSFVVTRAKNPHLHFPEDAAAVASAWRPTREASGIEEALALAGEAAGAAGLVVVAGTQSLIADALAHLRVPTRDLAEFTGRP